MVAYKTFDCTITVLIMYINVKPLFMGVTGVHVHDIVIPRHKSLHQPGMNYIVQNVLLLACHL